MSGVGVMSDGRWQSFATTRRCQVVGLVLLRNLDHEFLLLNDVVIR